MQKIKTVAWLIFSPSGLGLPVFLILAWPVLLSWIWVPRYIRYLSLLAGYVKMLLLTLEWARMPGFFLLWNFFPMLTPLNVEEAIAAYVLPLAILTPLIYWPLARKMSRPRAWWLALAWSFFLLQVTGSIPMVYLSYLGV